MRLEITDRSSPSEIHEEHSGKIQYEVPTLTKTLPAALAECFQLVLGYAPFEVQGRDSTFQIVPRDPQHSGFSSRCC